MVHDFFCGFSPIYHPQKSWVFHGFPTLWRQHPNSPTSRWSWWGTAAKPQGWKFQITESCFAIPLGWISKNRLTNPKVPQARTGSTSILWPSLYGKHQEIWRQRRRKPLISPSCRRCIIYLGYINYKSEIWQGFNTYFKPTLITVLLLHTHNHTKVQNATHQEHLGVSWAEKGHSFPSGPWRVLAWKNLGWRKPRHAETLRNQIEVEASDGGKIGHSGGDLFLALHVQMVDYQLPQ